MALYRCGGNNRKNIDVLSAYGTGKQTLEINEGEYVGIVFSRGHNIDSNYSKDPLKYYGFDVNISGMYEEIVPLSEYQLTTAYGSILTSTKYMVIKKQKNEIIKIDGYSYGYIMHINAIVIS